MAKKKTFFERLERFFNKKKTVIGLISSAVVVYLSSSGFIDQNLAILLSTCSGLIFGIGVQHKVTKARDKKTVTAS